MDGLASKKTSGLRDSPTDDGTAGGLLSAIRSGVGSRCMLWMARELGGRLFNFDVNLKLSNFVKFQLKFFLYLIINRENFLLFLVPIILA
jgi:hypothetical protein